jgi:hypothetical protein
MALVSSKCPNNRASGRRGQLGEGTHTVMLEKNRMQFINAVVGFLEEKVPQALK